jgi:hypothetical protein
VPALLDAAVTLDGRGASDVCVADQLRMLGLVVGRASFCCTRSVNVGIIRAYLYLLLVQLCHLPACDGQSVFFQPFPLVSNLTLPPALTSAVFAPAITITMAAEGAESGCAEGSVCAAVTKRYEQLFAIKTSANGPARPGCPANVTISEIGIKLDSTSEHLGPDTDESYEITITPFTAPGAGVVASVTARTVFGARHALEVMSQMVADDPASTSLTDMCGNAGWLAATPLAIRDKPANSYR